MRATLVLVFVAVLAGVEAKTWEEDDMIIVEAEEVQEPRRGKQWGFNPWTPAQQQWLQQWGGQQQQQQWQAPGRQFGGVGGGGQFGGQWGAPPGIPGQQQWGQQPQYPQYPGGAGLQPQPGIPGGGGHLPQYPQVPGMQPGQQYPGVQPGQQWPPPIPGVSPGGGMAPQYPGGGAGGVPIGSVPPPAAQPAPQPAPQPSPGVPAVPGGDGSGQNQQSTGPDTGSVNFNTCGVGKNYPIRYTSYNNYSKNNDEEAIERIHEEHPLRVVNGWPAERNEWPWIAQLRNNGRQFCGGSLIDDRHILTAAHCVAHMTPQQVAGLTVMLGDHDIRQVGESQTHESKAARVVRHKGFSQETLHEDIALVTLATPVPASMAKTVRPICLASGSDKYVGRMGTVVGWGSLYENGPQPSELMELTMEIWDNDKCRTTYGNQAPGGIISSMLCAGQKGKDSCSGDSGGPMVVGNGNTWEQVGVVSWGIGCGKAHFPGVYTRVTEMKSWIQKVQTRF